ncbi:MAG: hypothetical protein ABSE73_02855 [Planctomycetota bacterium]
MSKIAYGQSWVLPLLFLGLSTGVAGTALTHAEEDKDKQKDSKAEAEEEAQEAAREDAQETADRAAGRTGQKQRIFFGTFLVPSDPSEQTNPDVVGTLVTGENDLKPNQTYLVKAEKRKKEIVEVLKRFDAKQVQVMGKLRNQAKYLIVMMVIESGPSEPVKERRKFGNI